MPPRQSPWPAKNPPLISSNPSQTLQTLVERLENGELSLEESLAAFEQGIALTRECQGALAQAEQKVQILLERDGELAAQPFDAEPEA